MKKIISFLVLFLLAGTILSGQNWRVLNRQEKNSVIHSYYNKNNQYIALGVNLSGASGDMSGLAYKFEPVYGFLFKDRNLLYLNFIYEQGRLEKEQLYRKHRQYVLGLNYRYYLPEWKTYSMFFIQGGIASSYLTAKKDEGNGVMETSFFDLLIPFELGISIPINRFNIELSLQKEYRIFNDKRYYDFYSHKFIGQIRISYIIR